MTQWAPWVNLPNSCYLNPSHNGLEVPLTESSSCLKNAINIYTEEGRLGMAARHIKVRSQSIRIRHVAASLSVLRKAGHTCTGSSHAMFLSVTCQEQPMMLTLLLHMNDETLVTPRSGRNPLVVNLQGHVRTCQDINSRMAPYKVTRTRQAPCLSVCSCALGYIQQTMLTLPSHVNEVTT
jgi:hypothetical protein